MRCMCDVWGVFVIYEVYVWYMRCMCDIWGTCVMYEVYVWCMRCICDVWGVCVMYEVYVWCTRCMCDVLRVYVTSHRVNTCVWGAGGPMIHHRCSSRPLLPAPIQVIDPLMVNKAVQPTGQASSFAPTWWWGTRRVDRTTLLWRQLINVIRAVLACVASSKQHIIDKYMTSIKAG